MIVTQILGYAIATFCLFIGCYGFYMIGAGRNHQKTTDYQFFHLIISFVFLLLAFGLVAVTEQLAS